MYEENESEPNRLGWEKHDRQRLASGGLMQLEGCVGKRAAVAALAPAARYVAFRPRTGSLLIFCGTPHKPI